MISKFKGELVEFMTKDGFRLYGFLRSHHNNKIVLSLHGMGGNFYKNLMTKVSDIFLRNGYDTFSINTRGHDEVVKFKIKKGKKTKKIYAGTSLEKFEDCVYDIQAAVNVVKHLGYKHIMLTGHSTGCQKVAYFMYKINPREISAVILLAPSDDYNLNKKEFNKNLNMLHKKSQRMIKGRKGDKILFDFYKKSGRFWSAQRFDSVTNPKRVESRLFNYASDLKEFRKIKKPILVVWGEKEEYAILPVSKYIKLLREKTQAEIFEGIIIKGADHGFDKHENEMAKAVVKWLKEHVQ